MSWLDFFATPWVFGPTLLIFVVCWAVAWDFTEHRAPLYLVALLSFVWLLFVAYARMQVTMRDAPVWYVLFTWPFLAGAPAMVLLLARVPRGKKSNRQHRVSSYERKA